jgi:hypothetical protein
MDLERPAQREARQPRTHRAEPEGVDIVDRDAGTGERGGRRLHEQIVGALVPVLAEVRAAEPHDRHAIADAV